MFDRIRDAFSGIVQQQRAKTLAKDSLQGYKTSLVRMLFDMRLDPNEVNALQNQQRGLALDPREVFEVHREVLSDVVRHVLSDGIVTTDELDAIAQIGSALGLGWDDLPPHQVHQVHIAATILGVQQGRLPSIHPSQSKIRVVPDEVIHAEVGCQLLDERTYRQWVGGSSGVSVRIARGLSYRVGSTRGTSIPVTQIVAVDQGTFTITSRRIVFVGSRQNFSTDWQKVLSAEPMADGVAVSLTNRKKTMLLQYNEPSYAEVVAALLAHYMR